MNTKTERYKQIWLTKWAYGYLREKKRESIKNKKGKSMAEILDIIISDHKKNERR